MQLTDLEETPQADSQLSVEELTDTSDSVAVTANEDTVRNTSSLLANYKYNDTMSVRNVVSDIKNEYENNNFNTANGLLYEADVADRLERESQIQQISLNPDISFDKKKVMIDNLSDTSRFIGNDLNKIVMTQSLIQDSPNETFEEEELRSDLSSNLDAMVQGKLEEQRLYNSVRNSLDPGFTGMGIDFLTGFIPFVNNIRLTEALRDAKKTDDYSQLFQALTMSGEAKVKFRDYLRKGSPEERLDKVKSFLDMIKSSKATMTSTDSFNLNLLDEMLRSDYYTNFDRILDNVFSIADDTLLLAPLAKPIASTVSFLRNVRRASRDSVRGKVDPTSSSSTIAATNKGVAKQVNSEVASDTTDDTARAMSNTTRDKAIYDNEAHETGSDELNQTVRDKPEQLSARDYLSMRSRMLEESGSTEFTKNERNLAREDFRRRYYSGLRALDRTNMGQIMSHSSEATPNGVKIKSIFGSAVGGYKNADKALKMAEYALRDFGITKESGNLSIMKKGSDGNYHKLDKKPKGKGHGDFLVSVDFDYKFNPLDMNYDKLTTERNIFDSFKFLSDIKLSASTFGWESIVDPGITGAASAKAYRSGKLYKSFMKSIDSGWGKPFKEIPQQRQRALLEYIRQSDKAGTWDSHVDMLSHGFDDKEIGMLNSWRQIQDDMFVLSNEDFKKTKRAAGYGVITNAKGTTQIFGSKVSKGSVDARAKFLDVDSGDLVTPDLNELYKSGGTVVKLMTKDKIGDDIVEYGVIKDTQDTMFWRAFNDSDTPLSYRKGYFTKIHTARYYIEDENGLVKAVANDVSEAETLVQALADRTGVDPSKITYRLDRAKETYQSDDFTSAMQTSGMLSQRRRGQTLETDEGVDILDASYTMNPVESMVRNVTNLSRRVAIRPIIESTKQRFMSQYRHLIKGNVEDLKRFPKTIDDLVSDVSRSDEVRDARTMFQYIRSLEYGEINSLDSGYRAIMNKISMSTGKSAYKATSPVSKAAYGTLEKLTARMSEGRNPLQVLDNIGVGMFISLNPQRQLMFGLSQAGQNIPMNYSFTFSTKGSSQMLGLTRDILTNGKHASGESKVIYDQWKYSGLGDSIDRQQLYREGLQSQVEDAYSGSRNPIDQGYTKVKSGLGKVTGFARSLGVVPGESVNLMSAWLSARDSHIRRTGKTKLDKNDLDEITAKASSYTLDQHQFSDMPYTKNSMATFMRFFQTPHKSLLRYTNRNLTGAEKTNLALYNLALTPWNPKVMYSAYNTAGIELPDDPALRDLYLQGLNGAFKNHMLRLAFQEDTDLDWSSLSPTDINGVFSLFHRLGTEGAGGLIATSPGGSILFGGNPVLARAAKSWSQIFGITEPTLQEPATLATGFKDLVTLVPGLSNTFKSLLALEHQRVWNSARTREEDSSSTTPEALAMFFGIRDYKKTLGFEVLGGIYKPKKEATQDVKLLVDSIMTNLSNNNSLDDLDRYVKIYNSAMHIASKQPYLAPLIKKEITKRFNSTEGSKVISDMIVNNGVLMDESRWINALKTQGADATQLEHARTYMRMLNESAEEAGVELRDLKF